MTDETETPELISVTEFYKRTVSFREKFGTKLEPEMYANLSKMYTISYFRMDNKDPMWDVAVEIYQSTIDEFHRRMEMMGYPDITEYEMVEDNG